MDAPASQDDLPQGGAPRQEDDWELVPTSPEADAGSQVSHAADAPVEPPTPAGGLPGDEEDNRLIREPQDALTTAEGAPFAVNEDPTPRSLDTADTARSAEAFDSPAAVDGAADIETFAEDAQEEVSPRQGEAAELQSPSPSGPAAESLPEASSLQAGLEAFETNAKEAAVASATATRLSTAFQREQELVALNHPKVHDKWRKLMRDAKSEDLKKDIQTLMETHERLTERKAALLQSLAAELASEEELHAKVVSSHGGMLSRLIEGQRAKAQAKMDHFLSDMQEIEGAYTREYNVKQSSHNGHKAALEAVFGAMEADFVRLEAEAKHANKSARRVVANNAAENFNMVKLMGESRQDELSDVMVAENQIYTRSVAARTEELEQLRADNAKTMALVAARRAALDKGVEQIATARAAVDSAGRTFSSSSAAIRAEIDAMNPKFERLKRERHEARNAHADRMRRLAVVSASAEARLNARLAVGRRMLALAHLAGKYELERETLVISASEPLPSASGRAVQYAVRGELTEDGGESYVDVSRGQQLSDLLPELGKIQTHYSKALLEKALVDRECLRLRKAFASAFEAKLRVLQSVTQLRISDAAKELVLSDTERFEASLRSLEDDVERLQTAIAADLQAVPKVRAVLDASQLQRDHLEFISAHMPLYLPASDAIPSASASDAEPLPPGEGLSQDAADYQTYGSEGGDSDSQTLEAAAESSSAADSGKRGEGVSVQQAKPAPRRYISQPEFNSLSAYMTSRLTLDKVNAGLDEAARLAEANLKLLAAARSNARLQAVDRRRAQMLLVNVAGKEGVRGKHWFTEEDRRTAAVLKLDKTGRAITTILRHLSRLQEVRMNPSKGSMIIVYIVA
ncbi:hypothetical protein WJX73_004715 [Symbiochloris irregularis]|uniref:Dynein regulatory complex protein 1/2 N-terminal domain-containing protein n=1 Tax=Symbiochloris irregularis TaxID=706552 RepID=A0AAW1NV64_9CHLO